MVRKISLRNGGRTAPYDFFRSAVPVNTRRIEVVDTQFVGAQGDRFRLLEGAERKASAGLPDDGQPFTGLSKKAFWDMPGFTSPIPGCSDRQSVPAASGTGQKRFA